MSDEYLYSVHDVARGWDTSQSDEFWASDQSPLPKERDTYVQNVSAREAAEAVAMAFPDHDEHGRLVMAEHVQGIYEALMREEVPPLPEQRRTGLCVRRVRAGEQPADAGER